jgi:O-antigen/teichoic acid export membrane protein
MSEVVTHAPRPASRRSFVRNVFWGWLGVGVNIVIGILLSPIIIGRLGVEQYGAWVLLFSTVDYIRMLDFGFRAATVNACARSRARGDWRGVNREASTGISYFLATALVCLALVILLRDPLIGALNIPPGMRADARALMVVIACAVACRLVLSPLTAVLEAFQRFDLVNRANIAALVLRSVGSVSLLLAGYGLLEMSWMVLSAQLLENALTILFVRRVFHDFTVSPRLVDTRTLRDLFRFGRYSAVLAAANIVSIQAPSTLLGLIRGPLEVGFFTFPFRLLMYSAEGLAKVADVTSSVTAAFDETRRKEQVWALAVVVNRSCFTLFMPVAIFLGVYGTELLTVWTPSIAQRSGPLIPILLVMFLFGVAGQYNAGAILIGQGRHRTYSYAVVGEVIASVVLLLALGPRYGAVGAACAVSSTFVLNRGLFLAVLICRENGFPLTRYLREIYERPVLTGVPVLVGTLLMKRALLPGTDWPQLLTAAAAIACTYFSAAWFAVLPREQRFLLRTQAARFVTR